MTNALSAGPIVSKTSSELIAFDRPAAISSILPFATFRRLCVVNTFAFPFNQRSKEIIKHSMLLRSVLRINLKRNFMKELGVRA